MSRLTRSLMAAALASTLACGAAIAQTAPAPSSRAAPSDVRAKAEPGAWDKTKAMTRKQWNEAKKKWAQEKDQWKDCNDQSKREKLRGTKSWSFIAKCMTKS